LLLNDLSYAGIPYSRAAGASCILVTTPGDADADIDLDDLR
jgi:hypothetical protein